MADYSLKREERLRSLGAIRRLFAEGESGFVFPLRYMWYAEADTAPSVEVLFSVPKRYHKRANRRNLVRRRTKEAYRLQKQTLSLHLKEHNLDLALIYSTSEVVPYKKIAHAVRRILEQIAARL
ncbi:MAG: ribonuclease P protein component [Alistipes sp.]|nr:ribonuclease P [Rikenellaceae bacterium]MBQ6882247.1 ribonuclease P protein component [Alistipes sp.]MBR1994950.1 ribonuclease P protein component [Alistipes sp.]MBR3846302.1 ribonuclease P protein component [Alistipes sp.]